MGAGRPPGGNSEVPFQGGADLPSVRVRIDGEKEVTQNSVCKKGTKHL